jgi:hypothetical protein
MDEEMTNEQSARLEMLNSYLELDMLLEELELKDEDKEVIEKIKARKKELRESLKHRR